MKIKDKTRNIILITLVAGIIAASLSALTLFRLVGFYEQTAGKKIISIIILGVFYCALIMLASIFFILPHIKQVTRKSSLIFMIMLFLLLTGVLTLSSANYWGVPQLHQVKLCLDASNERGSLAIEKLVDPNTNRLYSPNSFGFDRYPISIESGECIDGELTNLLSRLTLALIGNQVDVTVQNNPPDGRFFISINEAPAVVVFDRESDEQTPDPIVVKDGFDQGKRVGMPWGQRWFQGLKLLIVLISALFISVFLFGLTETFFTFPVENNLHSHERAGNEN